MDVSEAPFANGAAEHGGEGPIDDNPWAMTVKASPAASLGAGEKKRSRVQRQDKATTGWRSKGVVTPTLSKQVGEQLVEGRLACDGLPPWSLHTRAVARIR